MLTSSKTNCFVSLTVITETNSILLFKVFIVKPCFFFILWFKSGKIKEDKVVTAFSVTERVK